MYVFSGGPGNHQSVAAQQEAQTSVPDQDQARSQFNRSNSVGANHKGKGWQIILVTYRVTLIISDGTGQAVIGGGGAPAGHVNGMPNKKSQSTSKLSAKGE